MMHGGVCTHRLSIQSIDLRIFMQFEAEGTRSVIFLSWTLGDLLTYDPCFHRNCPVSGEDPLQTMGTLVQLSRAPPPRLRRFSTL
jgi:hypothetical protein